MFESFKSLEDFEGSEYFEYSESFESSNLNTNLETESPTGLGLHRERQVDGVCYEVIRALHALLEPLACALSIDRLPLLVGLKLGEVHLTVLLDRLGSIQNRRVRGVHREHLHQLHKRCA